MRFIIAGMLLFFGAGYSQEVADDTPSEIVTPDDGAEGEVAISDSMKDWGCGCGQKNRGGKSK